MVLDAPYSCRCLLAESKVDDATTGVIGLDRLLNTPENLVGFFWTTQGRTAFDALGVERRGTGVVLVLPALEAVLGIDACSVPVPPFPASATHLSVGP